MNINNKTKQGEGQGRGLKKKHTDRYVLKVRWRLNERIEFVSIKAITAVHKI